MWSLVTTLLVNVSNFMKDYCDLGINRKYQSMVTIIDYNILNKSTKNVILLGKPERCCKSLLRNHMNNFDIAVHIYRLVRMAHG